MLARTSNIHRWREREIDRDIDRERDRERERERERERADSIPQEPVLAGAN
jgi:hypothetical protein